MLPPMLLLSQHTYTKNVYVNVHSNTHTHHMHQTSQACHAKVIQGLNHNDVTFWTESAPDYLDASSVSHAGWNYTGERHGATRGEKKEEREKHPVNPVASSSLSRVTFCLLPLHTSSYCKKKKAKRTLCRFSFNAALFLNCSDGSRQ